MFRPGLNARLGTGIVAHSSGEAVRNVQIRGVRPMSLERSASEASVRAKDALLGVSNLRKQQSGPMLVSLNVKPSSSNHTTHMESSDSGGSSESSSMSDGDSANIHVRSPSMVRGAVELQQREAKAVSGSMLEENEGENELDDEDASMRPESPARSLESEFHSIQREPESAATTWTDDKHSSFLNSMEATFVRTLYGQQGLGHLGVYGSSAQIDESEQDCVESRPVDALGYCTSHPTELFELVQGGHQQKSYYRPNGFEPPQATTAVLANPWVRHFKQKIMPSEGLSHPPAAEVVATPAPREELAVVDANQTNNERDENKADASAEHSDTQEKEQCGASEDVDSKEIHGGAEAVEVEHGLRLWHNRLQGGGPILNYSTSRKDVASWASKRPSAFEENGDLFATKRIKSTQQELAQKDLEMLEQYNAKQRAECVQVAAEHSEQATLEHARKAVDVSFEQPGAALASEHKETRKVVGRVAMDQVVPLLGRMDSYDSRSSVSFPDLNAPFPGAPCATGGEPSSSTRNNLSSVPDLNAPPTTINFTKDGEAVAWAPSMEERYFQELCSDEDGRNKLSLELPGEAGDSQQQQQQLSPMSNSRTWTWGLGGLRRRLHDPSSVVVPASQPSRPLWDGIHFSDPVVFRSSRQQI